jgi:hypothetical protein
MTPEQTATLKAALLADPALAQYIVDYRDDLIRDYYNAPAAPAYIVWRSSVTRQKILQNGFDWTRLDNLSVGKARVWNDIFVDGYINPSKPNVRTGIESVWVGTQADLNVRAAVYVHCKRNANRVEKLFATGTGSDAVPGLMAFEGEITTSDVSAMLSGER